MAGNRKEEFFNAMTIIKNTLNKFGTKINIEDYDGAIIKPLAPNNTWGNGKQTHIDVTGKQRDIFPYLASYTYFENPGEDTTLKTYFATKIPLQLTKSNLYYLNHGKIMPPTISDEKIRTHTTVVRSKRGNGEERTEISQISLDGEDFLALRKKLPENSFLVILKIKEKVDYEVYGLPPSISSDDQYGITNLKFKFFKLNTKTLTSLETFIDEIDEDKDEDVDKPNENDIIGENILFYGVPGSGKSWKIQEEYCNDESHMERVVFHPDYTYSDFVGQILPKVEDGDVSYDFTPGPFTLILQKAKKTQNEHFYLIIEEINRGNAPAIFGDVFQLLDRKQKIKDKNDDGYPLGTSEYGITNTDIAKIVYDDPDHKVRIPSNLTIIGTMNTSDQNVFTLDTAFQRRWNMEMIENTFDNVDNDFKSAPIEGIGISWERFCTTINEIILEKNILNTSSEDKRLGVYFVSAEDINDSKKFSEKVLKYLWDDAFKFSREDVFDVSQYNSLEAIIKAFNDEQNENRLAIFKQGVQDKLTSPIDADN